MKTAFPGITLMPADLRDDGRTDGHCDYHTRYNVLKDGAHIGEVGRYVGSRGWFLRSPRGHFAQGYHQRQGAIRELLSVY